MLNVNSLMVLGIVLCRITGVIVFNPILGRRSIPGIVKAGLALGIAYHVAFEFQNLPVVDYSTLEIIFVMIKEFAVGYAMGFVVQLFLGIFHIGGEQLDMQMGMSMASMYDPTSSSQISFSGNVITIMFTMLFFMTNSHMNLLAIAVKSFDVIPIGYEAIDPSIGIYIVQLFAYILVYAIQLTLPIMIVEITLEVAIGILMRVVPNINVFVINLQLKLAIGILVLFTIIPILVKYLSKLNYIMLERVEEVLLYFSSTGTM
ncbi:MAG: flagellar biosynthetic protein FliR [Eubacteriales bacterium]|nr:flagellar biosynthetic protein FliR [Eubacteriales bacterium]